MNKKYLIIGIVILLATNLITYLVAHNTTTALIGDSAKSLVATTKDKEYTSNNIYTTWVNNNESTTALDALLSTVDQDLLNKAYPANENPIKDEANKRYEQAKAYYQSQGQDFNEVLKQSNMTDADYKDSVVTSIQQEYLTNDYLEATITEDEVTKAYEETADQYRSSHILFKTEVKDDEALVDAEERAEKKAKAVITQLDQAKKDGKDINEVFANLAKEQSEDTSSKANGGDIGFSNSEEEAYMSSLDELEVGEYSATPVKTSYGYHVILKTDIKPKGNLSDESVYNKYKQQVIDARIEEDENIQNLALIKLRDDNHFAIKDDEMKELYKKSIEQFNN